MEKLTKDKLEKSMINIMSYILETNNDTNCRQAINAYRAKQDNITRLIDDIRGKLEADAKRSDITWASVGSLGHVEELLRELDEFL